MQFEYISVYFKDDGTGYQALLNEYGYAGWELVTVTSTNFAIFKRIKCESEDSADVKLKAEELERESDQFLNNRLAELK